MNAPPKYHLFEVYGVELEYMIVDQDCLDARPIADRLLAAQAGGAVVSDVDVGPLTWSNELVLHVIELKTNGPAAQLEGLAEAFQEGVRQVGALAEREKARLMPGAMHPWFDPATETRLWPHDYSPVYQAFDRIFGCQGHGWSNLQSAHLNLPFGSDPEFGRLHAAIRMVLPILPALAASSPVMDGRLTGLLDNRLEVYRTNSRRLKSVTGEVIPEPVFSRRAYENEILLPMYLDVSPHDPEGVLQDEFLNARGAIARFSRGSIEIRVLDVQEHPGADLAILALVVAVLKLLTQEKLAKLQRQRGWSVEPLAEIFRQCVRTADETLITNTAYLKDFDCPVSSATALELWRHLATRCREEGVLDPCWDEALTVILTEGPLARRLLAALKGDLSHPRLAAVYRRLADCLKEGKMFTPWR